VANETYVIRGGAEGRARLRVLSEVMGPATRALLAEAGVARGAVCLDVGCGGGDVTRELARLVGPEGQVTGVDRDPATLEIARRETAELGFDNVAYEAHDVLGWQPDRTWDVIYARFLLSHLADPGSLIATLRRSLRPGGALVLEDIDFRGHFSEPACDAFRSSVELYTEAVRGRGGDANLGPRLPGLLRAAGFEPVHVRLHQPVALAGGMKDLVCVTLESITGAILEQGLASAAALDETIAALRAFAADPHSVVGGPRVFQAWARAAQERPDSRRVR